MFHKVLFIFTIFIIVRMAHADEAAVDCVVVDQSELEGKDLAWRTPINSESIFFECVWLESEKDTHKYYVASPMIEANSGCGHSYVSLNPELTNVFGMPEPKISYYFYVPHEDICPQFSVDRYAKFPEEMSFTDIGQLYRSLNDLILGIVSSRSGFETHFSKMVFWRKWLGDFAAFRNVVLKSIPIDSRSIYVEYVSYCYNDDDDDDDDDDDGSERHAKDCISANVIIPSSGTWIIRFLWREGELIPLRVDALF